MRKTMKKRIFSLVVALAMLATSFITTIHAADDEKNVQEKVQKQKAQEQKAKKMKIEKDW